MKFVCKDTLHIIFNNRNKAADILFYMKISVDVSFNKFFHTKNLQSTANKNLDFV